MVLGSIPAAIVGLLAMDFFEEQFGSPTVAAVGLLVTAAFLIAGERLNRGTKTLDRLTWLDTLIIGSFQVLALLPGVSRSGTTIAAGLGRGLDRPTAARFSFLVGLPAIAGAGLLSILDIFSAQGSLPLGHYAAAFVAAAVVGYGCIAFLLNWVKRHTLYPFAIYCAVVGLLYLLPGVARSRSAILENRGIHGGRQTAPLRYIM
jgi:undecaprenyl-diphosphatase